MVQIKYIVYILLLLNISRNLESQEIFKLSNKSIIEEYNYYDKIEYDVNFSLKFIFPPTDPASCAFFDISGGISYGIVPEFYYIGIAGDAAIGLDWFGLIGLFSGDTEYDTDREYTQFGFSLGTRIYNLIRLFDFNIFPFFGCDFISVILPIPYIGLEISYKTLGIEYANYLPIGKNNITRHQISLKIHMSKK